MFFTSIPTIKSGNIPLILLANQAGQAGTHPFAYPSFFPGTKIPCIAAPDLKDDLKDTRRSLSLWLPPPTVPQSQQPRRRLFIAWTAQIELSSDPKFNGVDANGDPIGEFNFGTFVVGPQFQVLTTSAPSRPSGGETTFSSPTAVKDKLSDPLQTEDSLIGQGGTYLTELTGIRSVTERIHGDAMCHLLVALPYLAGWKPRSLFFYIRGIAVDQW